jgi:anaerobic magnesium-protoporphyrin IX monomethyl ester cyclase
VKILFFNPPHEQPISRRYSCSYYSPGSFLPPHDLLQLATCLREWNGAECRIVEAVGYAYTEEQCQRVVEDFAPELIVSLVGIETLGEDLAVVARMKARFPERTAAVFGYYPTRFSREILEQTPIDLALRCEPEQPLSDYVRAIENGSPVDGIAGLAGRREDGSIFSNPERRIEQIDDMPFPDYTLIDITRYTEGLLGAPCGAILSTRGCPFACPFCKTTFGRQVVAKKPESVVAEMEGLRAAGVQLIRFLDDTFTHDRDRVIAICRQLCERRFPVPWTCLARVDGFDAEMLDWMKRAGCTRILMGVESYSQHVLTTLGKRLCAESINQTIALVHDAGIETVGLFMVGSPDENTADFQETVRGALASSLDFLTVNLVTPYAGTAFFTRHQGEIDFTLIPYHCAFRDPAIQRRAVRRRRWLYLRFYLRPSVLIKHFRRFSAHPAQYVALLFKLAARNRQ